VTINDPRTDDPPLPDFDILTHEDPTAWGGRRWFAVLEGEDAHEIIWIDITRDVETNPYRH